jgi:hypothetical protein
LEALVSPGYGFFLGLLLLNDFLLKSLLHNWLTGKLSDFAGLFIFPLFWSALLPRFRRPIYVLTAIMFVIWKSAYAQSLIDAWNGLGVLPIYRTVDASDLLAMLILPFSFFYCHQRAGKTEEHLPTGHRVAAYLLGAISLFAFTATQAAKVVYTYNEKFYFDCSEVLLTRRIYHLFHLNTKIEPTLLPPVLIDKCWLEVRIPSETCSPTATIEIGEEDGHAVITLKKTEHKCLGRFGVQDVLGAFKKGFLDELDRIKLDSPVLDIVSDSGRRTDNDARTGPDVYLVAVGEIRNFALQDLAEYLRKKCGLRISILPSVQIQPGHTSREADEVIRSIDTACHDLGSGSSATVIGVTEDIFSAGAPASNLVYDRGNIAVMGIKSLDPVRYCEHSDATLLESRLRKIVAGTIGALYLRLPASEDPTSLLHNPIGCVDELDSENHLF